MWLFFHWFNLKGRVFLCFLKHVIPLQLALVQRSKEVDPGLLDCIWVAATSTEDSPPDACIAAARQRLNKGLGQFKERQVGCITVSSAVFLGAVKSLDAYRWRILGDSHPRILDHFLVGEVLFGI